MSAGWNGFPRDPVTVGPYRLLQRLGEGGMGVVHLALDPGQRAVALKVLRESVAADPDARRRLSREVETLRRVRHPRVAEVVDADVAGDRPYLVTRFVPGRTLEEQIGADGPLAAADVVRLGSLLAEALQAIHAAGIVHRDVKPANVMLLDGDPVLIDFGIAHVADQSRITMTGLVMGTPGYLSPEVVAGSAVTPATDWWGWGSTLAFAASGRPPFGTGPVEIVLDQVRRGEPDLSGVDPALARVLLAALAGEPAWRPGADVLVAGLHGRGPLGGTPAQAATVVQSPPGQAATVVQPPPGQAPTVVQPPQGQAPGGLRPPRPPERSPAAARTVAMPPPPDALRTAVQPGLPQTLVQRPLAPPLRAGAPAAHAPGPHVPSPQPPQPSPAPALGSTPAGPRGPAGSTPVGVGSGSGSGSGGSVAPRLTEGPLIWASLAALSAVAMVAPGLAAVVGLLLSVLTRAVDRSATGLARRRELSGRRTSDVPATVAALPWRVVMSTLAALFAAVVPLLVGASTAFIAGTALSPQSPEPTHPAALAAATATAGLLGWWGPGGGSLRRGGRTVVRSVAATQGARLVVLGVLGLVVVAALSVAAQGGPPDFAPFELPVPPQE